MRNMSVKRRYVTLIEMMIVMFLIALITGVVAYNYRGSLDEGKAFKTQAAIERIETILNLEAAQHPAFLQDVSSNWKEIIRRSPLVQNPDALTKDGWGDEYQVSVEPSSGTIEVHSRKYDEYRASHPSMFGK